MASKTKLPHPGGNLGKYLHKPKYKAKLSSEFKKVGGKPKPSKYSSPTVKKPTRRKMRKMQTPKEI
jgi:hypothetical protein